jgi:(p)ppGpp synthase/HD superfamily hydrolase
MGREYDLQTERNLSIIGLLHDVVEDTDCTFSDLRAGGYEDHIVTAVNALTRRTGEEYFTYIQRVSENTLATIVKLADLEVNLGRPGKDTLKKRYNKAREILIGEVDK